MERDTYFFLNFPELSSLIRLEGSNSTSSPSAFRLAGVLEDGAGGI